MAVRTLDRLIYDLTLGHESPLFPGSPDRVRLREFAQNLKAVADGLS
jgi:hypothetical protein